MKLDFTKNEQCVGCSSCSLICPNKCIVMEEDCEGYLYPKFNPQMCINCGLCKEVCPVLQHKSNIQEYSQQAFYGWNLDDRVRIDSSSGGAFSAIANKVLENGGVVFGAIYDEKLGRVVHENTLNVSLQQLRKSKYVESDATNTFQQVKEYLNQGRLVLYCSSPCKIAGLKIFLQHEYEKLITCDFICGGVNSNRVFQEYLNMQNKKYKSEVEDINFRPKLMGWSEHCICITFKNGKQYKSHAFADSYFIGFFKHIYLRKSCYSCQFSEIHFSDITLADFWAYKNVPSITNDEKGISLIVTNSQKGEDILFSCKTDLYVKLIGFEYAKYNYHPQKLKKKELEKRNEFFNYYQTKGYEKAIKKFAMQDAWKFKIKYILKSIVGKYRRQQNE